MLLHQFTSVSRCDLNVCIKWFALIVQKDSEKKKKNKRKNLVPMNTTLCSWHTGSDVKPSIMFHPNYPFNLVAVLVLR